VPGGVVARYREQDEEGGDLEVGEALAIDLGVDQGGDHVVARALAAVRRDLGRRRVQHSHRLAHDLKRLSPL